MINKEIMKVKNFPSFKDFKNKIEYESCHDYQDIKKYFDRYYLPIYLVLIVAWLTLAISCLQTSFISWFIQNSTNAKAVGVTYLMFIVFGLLSFCLYNFAKESLNETGPKAEKIACILVLITFTVAMTFHTAYSTYTTFYANDFTTTTLQKAIKHAETREYNKKEKD